MVVCGLGGVGCAGCGWVWLGMVGVVVQGVVDVVGCGGAQARRSWEWWSGGAGSGGGVVQGVVVRGVACLTHSLGGEHVVDGVVVLLRQDGQLAGLLLLQPLQHRLVVGLGRGLQQVIPQGLVLPRLDLTRVLELLLYLQLLGLGHKVDIDMGEWIALVCTG